MDYIPNTGTYCVGVSLTNLLVYLGDSSTAKIVAQNYRLSPLVRNNGDTHPSLVTRLVKDLTEGRYYGLLHINWRFDIPDYLRRTYRMGLDTSNVDNLVRIFEEETREGNILSFDGDTIRASFPNIIFLTSTPNNTHAVVFLGQDMYINDGNAINKEELSDLGLDPIPYAVLEVTAKTKKEFMLQIPLLPLPYSV